MTVETRNSYEELAARVALVEDEDARRLLTLCLQGVGMVTLLRALNGPMTQSAVAKTEVLARGIAGVYRYSNPTVSELAVQMRALVGARSRPWLGHGEPFHILAEHFARNLPDTPHRWRVAAMPLPETVTRAVPIYCDICVHEAEATLFDPMDGLLVLTDQLMRSTCRWPDPEARSEQPG